MALTRVGFVMIWSDIYVFVHSHHFYFPAQLVGGCYRQRPSGQAAVTGACPPRPPVFLIFIAYRVSAFALPVDFDRFLSIGAFSLFGNGRRRRKGVLCINTRLTSSMRSHKTRSTRDRSIPRSLQRRVSTNSSISQLTFFNFTK